MNLTRWAIVLSIIAIGMLISCKKDDPPSPVTSAPPPGAIGIQVSIDVGSDSMSMKKYYSISFPYTVRGATSISRVDTLASQNGQYDPRTIHWRLVIDGLQAGLNYSLTLHADCAYSSINSDTCASGKIKNFLTKSATVSTMPGGGPIIVNTGLTTELAPIVLVLDSSSVAYCP